jgi:predicted RNA-binding protein (virulence factor B family)
MIEVGKYNTLRIVKEVEFGLYLDGGGERFGEILLPLRYVPEVWAVDEMLEVFIYRDSEDRIIATTERPFATVGEFALLEVISVNSVGAFLDWGLSKDLLVPFREQKQDMQVGESYMVYVFLDEDSGRIAATSKLGKYLDQTPPDYTVDQQVDVLVSNRNEVGFTCIVNQAHRGIIYRNEVFHKIFRGQHYTGYVSKVREDNKIDIRLQKPSFEKVDDFEQVLLKEIERRKGFLPFTDKTESELIYSTFGVSKKTFKKAVGGLYFKRLITLSDDGITLVVKE